jgi:hypothetical protein
MDDRLDAILEAMRDAFARQAEDGNATYNGVTTDGLDALEGYFDLRQVAGAVLAALTRKAQAEAREAPSAGTGAPFR